MSASVVDAFCCRHPLLKSLLHIACAPFVFELTRLGIQMDGIVERDGNLTRACRWLVDMATAGIHIQGAQEIPRDGPLLFVGNHAGLGDAHSVLMSAPRSDTKVLAHDFGILPGLRAFRQHVIVVDVRRPQACLRASLRHLRGGGSLLLYPRGDIEPDPSLWLGDALASLSQWSRSMALFQCHVPGLAIVPVAVGGLLSRTALRNPIVRRYRDAQRRNFLAATLQMMLPTYRDPIVSVCYGQPLRGAQATRGRALAQMQVLLRQVQQQQAKLHGTG